MHEVIMPKLGLTMETGVIEKWHKKEGEPVESGDVLFEVMTDKVSLEVEAYNSGILKKIVRKEGEEVPVTEVVAYIGAEDEQVGQQEPKKTAPEPAKEEPKVEVTSQAITEEAETKVKASPLAKKIAQQKGIDLTQVKGTGPGGRIVKEDVESHAAQEPAEKRIKISPLARRLAREQGINYEQVKGTGPGGRIVKEDILKAKPAKKEAAKEAAAPGQIAVQSSTPLKGMRKTIAQRMSDSYSNVPHILQTAKVDVTNLISLRERLKEKAISLYGVKITYTDFILKIAAASLRELPVINSSLTDGNHIVYDDINVGMAMAVEEGLIVPTIYGTDKLSILDIAKKRIELMGKAKEGKLSLEEISNGTFTVSNLGMYKVVRSFTAIINPPQAAILAVGAIYSEPAVVGAKIEPRSFMEITLAVDHRILDGAVGAEFLEKIVEFIENPELMVM